MKGHVAGDRAIDGLAKAGLELGSDNSVHRWLHMRAGRAIWIASP